MGFFSELFGIERTPKESPEEIAARIENSEAGKVFLEHFTNRLSQGEDLYQYLIADTKDRDIFLKFYKNGVIIEYMNFSKRYFRANDTYTVDSEGIGFGASGYADLPNSSYVSAFKDYISKNLERNCPHLNVGTNGAAISISIKETAKVDW